MENKKRYISIAIVMMLLIVCVGTYAWLSYRSKQTAMVLTIGEVGSINIRLQPYKFNSSITPSLTYEENDYVNVKAINSSSKSYNIKLFYKINNIPNELISENFKYMILRSSDGDTYSEYVNGNFLGATSGSEFVILDEELISSDMIYYYRVYLWIDGSVADNTQMQGKVFDAELRADYNGTINFETITYTELVSNYSCANGSQGTNPLFTYTGDCEIVDDGNDNWKVIFLTSGDFTSNKNILIDAFLVGGGGGGNKGTGNGGGGGGYTNTTFVNIKANTEYEIVVGDGGAEATNGISTTAFDVIAKGGGGSGGSNEQAGNGGSGGGDAGYTKGMNGSLNIGGGGGGSFDVGGSGGSGIVIIRNSRTNIEDLVPVFVEAPVLDEGLIPVILSESSVGYKVTATASSDPNWYNYNSYYKQWANAVLVKESGVKTRTQNKVAGTEIDASDILAYFVWIPRYAYQIWTTGESTTGNEQEIIIEFEEANASYRAGTQVGDFRTHPAFWRDNNGNNTVDSGELVSGIWVGKFETTGDATTPTILPNQSPLVSQNVSTQFQTGLKFAGGTLSNGVVSFGSSNSYGIGTILKSYMMNSSEWGGIAYLSQSKSGICQNGVCKELQKNSIDTTGGNIYASGITSYLQSTTGNITGVFGMSGGVWDRVMDVFVNSEGNLWSGDHTGSNSGFNGLLGSSGISYTSGIPFPNEIKYYNKYQASSGTIISTLTACNGGICYGHALSETAGWYGDFTSFVSASMPWGNRGGYSANDDVDPGLFAFGNSAGNPSAYSGFRVVLSK